MLARHLRRCASSRRPCPTGCSSRAAGRSRRCVAERASPVAYRRNAVCLSRRRSVVNPLLRMVVSTSLSGAELVLTTALDGVRKINEALAPAAPRPPVAVLAKDPDVRGAGWRAPELGDLDAASAMLRGRATTGTSTPPTATSQATTAASPAPSARGHPERESPSKRRATETSQPRPRRPRPRRVSGHRRRRPRPRRRKLRPSGRPARPPRTRSKRARHEPGC